MCIRDRVLWVCIFIYQQSQTWVGLNWQSEEIFSTTKKRPPTSSRYLDLQNLRKMELTRLLKKKKSSTSIWKWLTVSFGGNRKMPAPPRHPTPPFNNLHPHDRKNTAVMGISISHMRNQSSGNHPGRGTDLLSPLRIFKILKIGFLGIPRNS